MSRSKVRRQMSSKCNHFKGYHNAYSYLHGERVLCDISIRKTLTYPLTSAGWDFCVSCSIRRAMSGGNKLTVDGNIVSMFDCDNLWARWQLFTNFSATLHTKLIYCSGISRNHQQCIGFITWQAASKKSNSKLRLKTPAANDGHPKVIRIIIITNYQIS